MVTSPNTRGPAYCAEGKDGWDTTLQSDQLLAASALGSSLTSPCPSLRREGNNSTDRIRALIAGTNPSAACVNETQTSSCDPRLQEEQGKETEEARLPS